MKKGIEYFDKPEFKLAKDYCKAYPATSGYAEFICCSPGDLDYFRGFAKIKDIPTIRKILEASFDNKALKYIDNFFNEFK